MAPVTLLLNTTNSTITTWRFSNNRQA